VQKVLSSAWWIVLLGSQLGVGGRPALSAWEETAAPMEPGSSANASPRIAHLEGRTLFSLNGSWKVIVDAYDTGFRQIRHPAYAGPSLAYLGIGLALAQSAEAEEGLQGLEKGYAEIGRNRVVKAHS
jgi:hypothetical protein